MAKDFRGKEDVELYRKISNYPYMSSAVAECYETLKDILYALLGDEEDKV